MERKLRNYFRTDKIDVVNAGIAGERSFGEGRRTKDYLYLQPNLLVYYKLSMILLSLFFCLVIVI